MVISMYFKNYLLFVQFSLLNPNCLDNKPHFIFKTCFHLGLMLPQQLIWVVTCKYYKNVVFPLFGSPTKLIFLFITLQVCCFSKTVSPELIFKTACAPNMTLQLNYLQPAICPIYSNLPNGKQNHTEQKYILQQHTN